MWRSKTGSVPVKPGNFWQRISDGIAIQEPWAQFRADSRSNCQLYPKDVVCMPIQGKSHWKDFCASGAACSGR
jgi:hypothetical protein